MKKTTVLLLLCIIAYGSSKAQTSAKAVYLEVGGPGLLSVNYDMRLSPSQDGIGFRAGVGAFSVDGVKAITVPLGLNYLMGKNKSHLELGAGYTILNVNSSSESTSNNFNESFFNLTIGYRYAPLGKGFLFKAELTPVFSKNFSIPYFAGLGFGYKF